MTDVTQPDNPRSRISSTPVLRAALLWGFLVGAVVALAAAGIGYAAHGGAGAASGALGAAVGIVFPALTALSILLANRWYGSPAYLQIYLGIVMGGWLLKFVLVIVALVAIAQLAWVVPIVFYFSLIAAAVAALVVDLIVLSRMRLPAVSDITLPGEETSS